MFSALLSALFSALFFVVTVWRIVGRGENPVGPGTSVPGGVRTRSVYLNCHGRIQNDEIKKKKKWPSTACFAWFYKISAHWTASEWKQRMHTLLQILFLLNLGWTSKFLPSRATYPALPSTAVDGRP